MQLQRLEEPGLRYFSFFTLVQHISVLYINDHTTLHQSSATDKFFLETSVGYLIQ